MSLLSSQDEDRVQIKKQIVDSVLHRAVRKPWVPDQAGKDVTIYAHGNPEKSEADWYRLFSEITETFVEKRVPTGYVTLRTGNRADVAIRGTDYISYRYEIPPDSNDRMLDTMQVDRTSQSLLTYQEDVSLHPPSRYWLSNYTVTDIERVLLEEINRRVTQAHEQLNLLLARDTDSSSELSSQENSSEQKSTDSSSEEQEQGPDFRV